jgi:hypothetical protein
MVVRIEGYRELRRELRRLEDAMDVQAAKGDLKQMNLDAARLVRSEALRLVPVQTGLLKSTVREAATQRNARVRAGFQRVPYAGPIHFGWPSRPNPGLGWRGGPIRPQPFLYDALDRRRNEVVDAYERNLRSIIRKYDLD